jgi:CDP-diacylglycerol--glycerol-3-phosphate 3-phosphatidyltransferase/cardiolipin synthase
LPAIFVFFLTDMKLTAISIFVVAALTDFFDGFIARKYNLVSPVGKLLDPIADKMLFYSGLILISLSGVLPTWASCTVFFIMLLRDFAVDCLRMLAGMKGIVLAANVWGKLKTAVSQIAVPYLMFQSFYNDNLIFNIIGYSLIGLATALCLFSGIFYFAKNNKIWSS